MKKMKKMLAVFVATTLVASIMVGVRETNTVEASEKSIELSNWTFTQGGMYIPYEQGNEGYINSVTMNGTDESLTGWLRGNGQGYDDPSINQTMAAEKISDGFTIDIENTGWDAWWQTSPYRINPWSILSSMNDVTIKPGHRYTVSFKAKSSKKKYAYVTFGSDIENETPYGSTDKLEGQQVITIGSTDQVYTYNFVNWISATKLNTTIMLGAFTSQYDTEGNNISNIITEIETGWKGTVTISDFKIIDEGLEPEFIPVVPEPEKPTVQPQPTTPEPTSENETDPDQEEGENFASNVTWNWFSVCPLDGEDTLDEEHNGHVQGEDGSEEHPYCWYHSLTNSSTSERPDGYVEGIDFATKGWVVPGTTASNARLYAKSTGWDGRYDGYNLVDDNPYGLKFYTSNILVKKNCTYTLSFKYTSDMIGMKRNESGESEIIYTKHIGLELINPQNGDSLNFTENNGCTKYGIFVAERDTDEKTITVKFKIPADYEGETVFVQLNAGAYLFSYPDEMNMSGSLYVRNLKLVAKAIDNPTTVEPTTVEPTTVEPTTVAPTTVAPTTVQPATEQPTTEPEKPTTVEPATVAPTTAAPTTVAPITVEPETAQPTTVQPATEQPTTEPEPEKPTTVEPATVAPTTKDTQTKTAPADAPTKAISYDKTDRATETSSVSKTLGSTSVTKAAKSKKAAKVSVTFKKINGAAKYQVQISTSKKFKKVLVNKIVKKVTATISSKKLKNKKKLYIRVRAVGTDKWSKPKKIKIK